MNKLGNLLFASAILVQSAPAHAAGAFVLPDPSGLTLFTLGLAGLAIGRKFAGKRKD